MTKTRVPEIEVCAAQYNLAEMVRILILIPFFLLFGSCENSRPVEDIRNQVPEANVNELSIKMQRGGCYGRCPIYSLDIASDGMVSFEGKYFTKVTGKAETRISSQQIERIIAAINAADFFAFDDAYDWDSGNCPLLATDSPEVTLQIKLGYREKTVKHYLGCLEKADPTSRISWSDRVFPQKLYLLENAIDELAETEKWTKEDEIK